MGLEHWDSARGRWVLYRSQAQHSLDCEQHPFEAIPRRVFLDTNVVNLLVKYSEQVFEQAWLPAGLDVTRAHDVEALMHVFHIGGRAPWEIVASRKTLSEIGETPEPAVRDRLLDYAGELVGLPTEDVVYAANLGRRLIDSPFTEALPDPADRELIGNAVGLGCDVFCTCDRRTIVRKREHLRQLPIRILTPAEWWAHIKPWAALWG
ncbi:hypothetical protein [Phenylobacterium sp.]|uniref:hypothetical protein n=1 Tax=Phenylobacterium sp. TaxID=1871053 RepID=UPI0025CD19D9|nr:hypothetical protein [Phenylobacterium sp.]